MVGSVIAISGPELEGATEPNLSAEATSSSAKASNNPEPHDAVLNPIDRALEDIGFGRFQIMMMAICGMAWFVDSVEAGGLAYIYVTLDAEWRTTTGDWGLLQSVKSLCSVAGALGFGMAADKFGRRPAFLGALAATSLAGMASAASQDFYSLLVLRSLTNVGAGGILPVSISLLAEHLPPSSRESCMVLMQIFFTCGHVLAVVLAMLLPTSDGGWRMFLIALALPTALLMFAWPLIPESPSYLQMSGQETKAKDALRNICLRNKGGAEALVFSEDLQHSAQDQKADQSATGVARLFSTRRLAVHTCLFGLLWALTNSASDFGNWITEIGHEHGIQSHQVEGFMIVFKVVGVAAFITSAVFARGGRGPLILRGGYLAATLAAAAASAVVTLGGSRVLLAVSMAVLFIPYDVVWSLIYATTASSFDSHCRASALAVATCFSRAAATVVPLITGKLLEHHEFFALSFWTLAWAAATCVACLISFSVPEQNVKEVKDLSAP
ncbi:unnamed protein product [Polarella glacialis]|uniref:Major facilitator superfamily (MFS) profile domain-containing protein n=1 Tax=Polarella glacialis TaxID=89957 RepID=A0A813GGB8_POLGL|nr:unnamed protein product [Polarella glacialis]CAE8682494.1 unnamed protein product [Polarella glacialis]